MSLYWKFDGQVETVAIHSLQKQYRLASNSYTRKRQVHRALLLHKPDDAYTNICSLEDNELKEMLWDLRSIGIYDITQNPRLFQNVNCMWR